MRQGSKEWYILNAPNFAKRFVNYRCRIYGEMMQHGRPYYLVKAEDCDGYYVILAECFTRLIIPQEKVEVE